MATRTNPLVSAAVLASAAAIAVASPAIMPSVQVPSPHALEAAKVQLTTFSDLLSITATDYSNILFAGYGEAISPNQDPGFDWAAAYISPFLRCDFNCKTNGPSGIAYVVLDALINGNGTGYAPVYDAKGNPIAGYPTWNVSSVNYFFEGGPGAGTAYFVAQPFGDPKSPLYNPTIASVIAQAFNGLSNVTTFYVAGLDALSKLAKQVPAVGPYIYGAIQAYLGPNTSDEFFGNWGYRAGLSGILRYVSDVITTGGNPYPPYGPQPTSGSAASVATLAAAAVPAAATTAAEAPKVEAAPASRSAKEAAPADTSVVAEAKVSAPADTKTESAPAVSEAKVSAPVDNKPAANDVKDSTPAVVDTPSTSVPDNTPAPEVKVPEAPSGVDTKPSTPAAPEDTAPSAQEVKDMEKEAAKAESSSSASSSAGSAGESKGSSDAKAGGSAATSGASEATSSASEATSAAAETKAGASDAGSAAADSAKDAGESAK